MIEHMHVFVDRRNDLKSLVFNIASFKGCILVNLISRQKYNFIFLGNRNGQSYKNIFMSCSFNNQLITAQVVKQMLPVHHKMHVRRTKFASVYF